MEKLIQIALVDDDKLVVELMQTFLDGFDDIKVLATFNSGNSFIDAMKSEPLPIDIVLSDLKMEDGDGMYVIDALSEGFPEVKIIVLSSYYRASFLGQMLKKGVHGFLPKETDKEDLVKIIREVSQKGYFFTTDQMEVIRQQVSSKTPKLHLNSIDSLSDREIEVLKLICNQYTAKEIGDKLHISTKTVEAHKSNLMVKTGVKNTAGLIIYAVKNKIINPENIFLEGQ